MRKESASEESYVAEQDSLPILEGYCFHAGYVEPLKIVEVAFGGVKMIPEPTDLSDHFIQTYTHGNISSPESAHFDAVGTTKALDEPRLCSQEPAIPPIPWPYRQAEVRHFLIEVSSKRGRRIHMDDRRPTRSPPTGRGIISANETRNAIGHAAFGSSLLFIIERCSRRGRSVVYSFVDDPASTVTR